MVQEDYSKLNIALSQKVKQVYAKTQYPIGTEFVFKINFNRNGE